MHASETFCPQIGCSCCLRCRRSTKQWLVCRSYSFLGLKYTILLASAQRVASTCGIVVSVLFLFISNSLISWCNSLAEKTHIEIFATVLLQNLSLEYVQICCSCALLTFRLYSERCICFILSRMGIFHVARRNTLMRYHKCVVFCRMLFEIWLFLYFLVKNMYRPESFP